MVERAKCDIQGNENEVLDNLLYDFQHLPNRIFAIPDSCIRAIVPPPRRATHYCFKSGGGDDDDVELAAAFKLIQATLS